MKKSLLSRVNIIWLFIILAVLIIILLLIFNLTPVSRLTILTISALVYITMALLYHHKQKTLRVEVMIEYILIAALAMMIALSYIN